MEDQNNGTVQIRDTDGQYCWVCFATQDEDSEAEWVRPCRCRGTTKWVHQSCLQRWIDEKQRGNSTTSVTCPQCNTKYIIVFPPYGHVVYIMDLTDRMLYKICPFVAAGVVVGSVYWTAVTYGAVTVMQVLGHKEGLTVMEEADPLFLLVGLPTIPIMLILGKMVRWEDFVLKFWRRHCGWIKLFSGSVSASSSYYEQPRTNGFSFSDPISATRVLCGALMLPTIATVFGRVFFNNIPSSLQRALLGGIMFVAIKGAFKIYLKQQQYIRKCKRRILDFSQDIEDISNQYQPDL
ncbi:E3 ubiquitin-protein ligase MARCHF5-like isoform X2 [Tachypleus tridentatus]|uniref:E3 ubiquitin-protein ligase MARCHF5-like isoform X2 n=1 Tax=Tachypleus tridentatus TaxID=6853 RepID=UPI003FD53707